MMELPIRSCPCCDSKHQEILFSLQAKDFCELNWTYSKNWEQILSKSEIQHPYPISRCLDCNFVFAKHALRPAFLNKVYDSVIDQNLASIASKSNTDIARRMRYLSQLLPLIKSANSPTFLDYGCGYGMTTKLLFAAGIRGVGLDSSASRVQFMCNESLPVVPDLKDTDELQPFDLIVLDNVLEHLLNPREILEQIASVSKIGGYAYVSVPSYEKRRLSLLKKKITNNSMDDLTLNPWEHLNYFTLTHLDKMMAQAGFAPLRACETAGSLDVGLRAETGILDRTKNALASFVRLARFVVTGDASETVENRIYRFEGLS